MKKILGRILTAAAVFGMGFTAMTSSAQSPADLTPPRAAVAIVGKPVVLVNEENDLLVTVSDPSKVPVITLLKGGATFAQRAPTGTVTTFKVSSSFATDELEYEVQTALGSAKFKQAVVAAQQVVLVGPQKAYEGAMAMLSVYSKPNTDLGTVTLMTGTTKVAEASGKDGFAIFTLRDLKVGKFKYIATSAKGDSNSLELEVLAKPTNPPVPPVPTVTVGGKSIVLVNEESDLVVVLADPSKVPVITLLKGGATFAQKAPTGKLTTFKVSNAAAGEIEYEAQTAVGSAKFKQTVLAAPKVMLLGPQKAIEGGSAVLSVYSNPQADLGTVMLMSGTTKVAEASGKEGRAVFTLKNLKVGKAKYVAKTSKGDSNEFELEVVAKPTSPPTTPPVGCAAGGLSVSTNSVNLGTAESGTQGRTDTISLSNSCDVTVEILELKATGAFSVKENTCGETITPKEVCQIVVQFTPAANQTGPQAGSVVFRARGSSGGVSIEVKVVITVKGFAKKDIFAHNGKFVEQQYEDFYKRGADDDGKRGWENALNGGKMTREGFVKTVLDSKEFDDSVAPLVRLYAAALGRMPEKTGLESWQQAIKNGTSLEQVAAAFADSQEFRTTFGSLSDGDFIDQIYNLVFGRKSDEPGKVHWEREMKGGMSRGKLLLAFSESVEGKAIADAEVKVYMAYLAMLGRDVTGDKPGFEYHVARVQRGASIEELLKSFIDSAEYRARFIPQE